MSVPLSDASAGHLSSCRLSILRHSPTDRVVIILVFAANQPPQSADSSGAFFRRWLVVPFERTFIGQDEIPRNVLDARLADPQELSGELNMALSVLHRIRAQGITESQSMREAWRQFQQVAHPIMAWLDTYTIEDAEAYVIKADLLQAYNDHAKANRQPVLLALDLLGYSPGQAIMIGDTLFDMQAGRRAGTRLGAALWAARDIASLLGYDPEYTFAHPAQLGHLCSPKLRFEPGVPV